MDIDPKIKLRAYMLITALFVTFIGMCVVVNSFM
jgi:hypothetical protein